MKDVLSQLSMPYAELALWMRAGVVPGSPIGWGRTVEDRHFGRRIHILTSLAVAEKIRG